MKAKYKVTQVTRDSENPIVKILVNELIEKDIFYLNGIPHIVGKHMRFEAKFTLPCGIRHSQIYCYPEDRQCRLWNNSSLLLALSGWWPS